VFLPKEQLRSNGNFFLGWQMFRETRGGRSQSNIDRLPKGRIEKCRVGQLKVSRGEIGQEGKNDVNRTK